MLTYFSTGQIEERSGEMDRKADEKDTALTIEVSLSQVSSAIRGFLLTGNEAMLSENWFWREAGWCNSAVTSASGV